MHGIATDILLEASQLVKSPVQMSSIKLHPWARVYRIVRNTPNTVLFSTGKTLARENLFKWAGPISRSRIVILAKKSNHIEITHSDELAYYSIGVVLDDIGEQLVLRAGASAKNLQYANTAVPLAKMLHYNRIQLWAYEENVAYWSIQRAGLSRHDFEVVHELQTVDFYFAFNKTTDDSLVEKLQEGIDMLKSSSEGSEISTYDKILAKYRDWGEAAP